MTKKVSQKNLISRFERELKQSGLIQKGDTIIVALSGGPDSVCLFDLLFKLKDKLEIKLLICHYNHKIRGKASDMDERFVVKLCQERGVDLLKDAHKGRKSIRSEQEAREVRYDFFEKILKKERVGKMAIAHNADDLSETLIFRLVRGSGPKGLKSILQVRGKFIRPLLDFRKDEILKYLKSERLSYCKDATNDDIKYKRNYIRHKVIPRLKKINPKAVTNINNFSKLLEEQNDYIDGVTDKHSDKLVKKSGKKIEIKLSDFEKLEKVIQSNLILKIALSLGYDRDISIIHINNVLEMILKKEGKKYLLLPHSLRVEIKSGKIILS